MHRILRDRVQPRRIIGHWSRDNSHRPPVKKFPRSIVEKFAVLTVAFPGDCRAVALRRWKGRKVNAAEKREANVPRENSYILFAPSDKIFVTRIGQLISIELRELPVVEFTMEGSFIVSRNFWRGSFIVEFLFSVMKFFFAPFSFNLI